MTLGDGASEANAGEGDSISFGGQKEKGWALRESSPKAVALRKLPKAPPASF